MEELLKSIWAQAGAFGLLTASGWMMFWLERKQRLATQEKLDSLLEKIITFTEEQRDLMQDLVNGLDIKEMIRTEMRSYSERRKDG